MSNTNENFDNFTNETLNNGDMIIDIPFPYKKFTDTPFFIIDIKENLLIPERYYSRVSKNVLKIKDPSNELKLTKDSQIKFIFLHNKNKLDITKFEYSFKNNYTSTSIEDNMHGTFDSYIHNLPNIQGLYDKNYNINFQLYFNRKMIFPEINYRIDFSNNKLIIFNSENLSQKNLYFDIVCFYSESENNSVVQNLPQSGYIYLDKNLLDRNYNPNLMALFLNGLLVNKDNILQINNDIYKINTDIQTRYDLNILNMSPKIETFIPFYKNFVYEDYEKSDI